MNGWRGFPSLLNIGPALPLRRRCERDGSRRSEYVSRWEVRSRASVSEILGPRCLGGVGGVGGARERIRISWEMRSSL